MVGRILIPITGENLTERAISDLDDSIFKGFKGLCDYGYAQRPFIYFGGEQNAAIDSIQQTDKLYICAHGHLETSRFQLGSGTSTIYITATDLAKKMADAGLPKGIAEIELFSCHSSRSLGTQENVEKLRELADKYLELEKEKESLKGQNKEHDKKKFIKKVFAKSNDERNRKIVLIEADQAKIRKDFADLKKVSLYVDYQNADTQERLMYQLPLALELKQALEKLGYDSVSVKGYLGETSIVNGAIKVVWPQAKGSKKTYEHYSDEEDHGSSTGWIIQKPFSEAFTVF